MCPSSASKTCSIVASCGQGWHRVPCVRPKGDAMRPTRALHELGQSLWLDNITRELLNSDTLQGYINDFSVTGLTSNPTLFDHAIMNRTTYDGGITRKAPSTKARE